MRISVKREIIEEIVNYMATKPYREVAKFMAELQMDIKEIPEPVEQSESGIKK